MIINLVKSRYYLPLLFLFHLPILKGCKKATTVPSFDPIQQGTLLLYNNQDPGFTNRLWQGIPTIQILPNNEIYAAWYSGAQGEGVGNYITVAQSSDLGKTWRKNTTIVNPDKDYRVFDPCLWYNSKSGKLHLFYGQSYGSIWDGVAGVWELTKKQNDQDWSAPRRLANGVMINKPYLFNDTALYPIAYWNNVYNFVTPPKYPEQAGINIFARPRESKLELLGKIPISTENEEIGEPQVVKLKSGAVMGLIRGKNGVYESTSVDGKVWPQAVLFEKCGISTNSRFSLTRLASGSLMLIMNSSKWRSDMTVFISTDEGKTWPYHMLLDKRNNVSYPDVTENKNGQLFAIYDRDRYGAKEIIMVGFTEKMIRDSMKVKEPQLARIIIDK